MNVNINSTPGRPESTAVDSTAVPGRYHGNSARRLYVLADLEVYESGHNCCKSKSTSLLLCCTRSIIGMCQLQQQTVELHV